MQEWRRSHWMILADVVLEAVLALTRVSALRALHVTFMHFVCMIGEVVLPHEGLGA